MVSFNQAWVHICFFFSFIPVSYICLSVCCMNMGMCLIGYCLLSLSVCDYLCLFPNKWYSLFLYWIAQKIWLGQGMRNTFLKSLKDSPKIKSLNPTDHTLPESKQFNVIKQYLYILFNIYDKCSFYKTTFILFVVFRSKW